MPRPVSLDAVFLFLKSFQSPGGRMITQCIFLRSGFLWKENLTQILLLILKLGRQSKKIRDYLGIFPNIGGGGEDRGSQKNQS